MFTQCRICVVKRNLPCNPRWLGQSGHPPSPSLNPLASWYEEVYWPDTCEKNPFLSSPTHCDYLVAILAQDPPESSKEVASEVLSTKWKARGCIRMPNLLGSIARRAALCSRAPSLLVKSSARGHCPTICGHHSKAGHVIVCRGVGSAPSMWTRCQGAWQMTKSTPPLTSRDELAAYADRTLKQQNHHFSEQTVIKNMKLVGMAKIKAITSFTVKSSKLQDKLNMELMAQGVPEDVGKAILEGLEDTRNFQSAQERFSLDPNGKNLGKILKYFISIKPDEVDEDNRQVAVAVFGTGFDAARLMDHYVEETEPVIREVDEVYMVAKADWLGRRYEKPVKIKVEKQVGEKVIKKPYSQRRSSKLRRLSRSSATWSTRHFKK